MREQRVVDLVKAQLVAYNRYFVVFQGTNKTRNGTADILTVDGCSVFTGVECKRPGGRLSVNQWRTCLSMLRSGCRYVVAGVDFDYARMLGLTGDGAHFERVHVDADPFMLWERFTRFDVSTEIVSYPGEVIR